MKNNLKVICGTMAGIMIGGITVVGANQAIQAMQNTEIKVSLNGQVQTFKDETTGETQYPITYNNRTYLPLRNVAQLAGLDVDYDATNNIAILKNKEYEEKSGKIWELLKQEGYNPSSESNGFDNNDESAFIGYNSIDDSQIKIPYIKIDSDDVKKINEELQKISEDTEWIKSISSAAFLNNDILSLACFVESEYGVSENEFFVYNVSIKNGKKLTNKDLLKSLNNNYTEETVKSIIKDEYTKQFILQNDLVNDLELNFGIRVSYIDLFNNLVKNDEVVSKDLFVKNTANTTYDYESTIGLRNTCYKNTIEQANKLSLEEINMFIGNQGDIMYLGNVIGFAGAT